MLNKYKVSTVDFPAGIIYSFHKEEKLLMGIEVGELMPVDTLAVIFSRGLIKEDDYINFWKTKPHLSVVQTTAKITFDMFWKKYDDASRSSKKRSRKIWDKLDEENHVKAYFYYDIYNRNRGTAEKKYCETYLSAEMWNN